MSIADPQANGWRASDLHFADIENLTNRFHASYERGEPAACWLWQGRRNPAGYGWFSRTSRHVQPNLLAHRVAWVLETRESLTDNLTIDHLCHQPSCVNPAHLEPVTLAENIRRKRVRPKKSRADYRAKENERLGKRRPCPACGGMYRLNYMSRHRPRCAGAA